MRVPYLSVPCCTVPYRGVPFHTDPNRFVAPGRGAQAMKYIKWSWMHECPVPFRTVSYRAVLCRTVLHRSGPIQTAPYHFFTVPYRSVPFCTRGRGAQAVQCMKRSWMHECPVQFRTVLYGSVPCCIVPYRSEPLRWARAGRTGGAMHEMELDA